jgi:hypothetical protein
MRYWIIGIVVVVALIAVTGFFTVNRMPDSQGQTTVDGAETPGTSTAGPAISSVETYTPRASQEASAAP